MCVCVQLSSHQIWHVFVVLGIYIHHTACVLLYERWLNIGHCDAHDLIEDLGRQSHQLIAAL